MYLEQADYILGQSLTAQSFLLFRLIYILSSVLPLDVAVICRFLYLAGYLPLKYLCSGYDHTSVPDSPCASPPICKLAWASPKSTESISVSLTSRA